MLRLPAVCCWRHPGAGRGSGASFCGAAFLCACPGWEGNSSGGGYGYGVHGARLSREWHGRGRCGEDLRGGSGLCRPLGKVMSAMDAESGLTRLNAAEYGISVPVSPELERVLLLSLNYARLTNGAFDPTLGPCIRLWKRAAALASSRPMRSGNAHSGHADGKSCPSVREWRSRRFLE